MYQATHQHYWWCW